METIIGSKFSMNSTKNVRLFALDLRNLKLIISLLNRNASGSSGEGEMLWEHKSTGEGFHSFSNSTVFYCFFNSFFCCCLLLTNGNEVDASTILCWLL